MLELACVLSLLCCQLLSKLKTEDVTAIFNPHTSAYIPDPSSCTRLVFAYFVALFQCFRMIPVSCSSGGANKNVQQKTAPLLHAVRSNRSCTTASLHKAVRGYNLKRWISIVDSLIYKTAGRVSAYSFSLVGRSP